MTPQEAAEALRPGARFVLADGGGVAIVHGEEVLMRHSCGDAAKSIVRDVEAVLARRANTTV